MSLLHILQRCLHFCVNLWLQCSGLEKQYHMSSQLLFSKREGRWERLETDAKCHWSCYMMHEVSYVLTWECCLCWQQPHLGKPLLFCIWLFSDIHFSRYILWMILFEGEGGPWIGVDFKSRTCTNSSLKSLLYFISLLWQVCVQYWQLQGYGCQSVQIIHVHHFIEHTTIR